MHDLPARLRERIVLDEVHPVLGTRCWCWTGRLNRNGYGRAWWCGREPVVHRTVWEILRGLIPEGLILDHLCKVRRCVNPDHLEPVTHLVNTLRGDAILFKPYS